MSIDKIRSLNIILCKAECGSAGIAKNNLWSGQSSVRCGIMPARMDVAKWVSSTSGCQAIMAFLKLATDGYQAGFKRLTCDLLVTAKGRCFGMRQELGCKRYCSPLSYPRPVMPATDPHQTSLAKLGSANLSA